MAEVYRKKKKYCMLCAGKTVDYKDPETLKRYMNDRCRIMPRRVTGNCAFHQREVAKEIKRARAIGLVAYTK